MGYYASYTGTLTTKPLPDEIKGKLFEIESFNLHYGKNITEITFDNYDKYYPDNWRGKDGFLAIIQPYMISGEVTFAGEDDYFWCYTYDPGKHGFVEGSGRIEYDFDEEVMRFE